MSQPLYQQPIQATRTPHFLTTPNIIAGGGYDHVAARNRGEGTEAPVVPQQTAVSWPSDPFARSYASPYNDYVGWEEAPLEDVRVQAVHHNHYPRQYSWHDAPNNSQNLNLPFEVVASANDMLPSVTETPHQRGAYPREPNNHPPDAERYQRNPASWTFFRNWTASQRDSQGFDGAHISMGDNIIVQPVGGMRPNYERNRRNTYRIEPEPWDLNYTDVSADSAQNAAPPSIPMVPPNVHGHSYRLG